MERLEQERKMKELEELRRKVWTWSQIVRKLYKTEQKVYIANPDKELGRLAVSLKFVASKTSFAQVSKGADLTFFHVNTHFLTVPLYVISLILVVLLYYMLLCHTVGLKSDAKSSW